MEISLRDKINFYKEFHEFYIRIINDFGFEYDKDVQAARVLSKILNEKSNWELNSVLISFKQKVQQKRNILVYGCGPSLESTINQLFEKSKNSIFKSTLNIAADGASVFLKEKSIQIDAVFTDLDGITDEEFNYAEYLIVHAHGDNIESLKKFKKSILHSQKIIGTVQVKPLKNLLNPGGFTDGDRILFFLKNLLLLEQKIFLIGFDFNDIIGRYSKPYMLENQKGNLIKIKKLKYAIELIFWVSKLISNKIIFVNSESLIDKVNNISIEEFEKLIFN